MLDDNDITQLPNLLTRMGFIPTHRRDGCQNCAHLKSQWAEGSPFQSCGKGGFSVTLGCICNEYERGEVQYGDG